MFRAFGTAAVIWVLLGAAVYAQTPGSTSSRSTEPAMPDVVVQPAEPSPSEPGTASSSPFDLPLSYPGLRQQAPDGSFGGLDSGPRGTRSLYDAPNLDTVIGPQELRERQPQDMFQALQQEVGVMMQRTARGQSSPYIRGLTGQQVLILVDGIRVNDSTFRAGANQYFSTIDPGMVQRIEVLRGPQSVLYGSDAIGGAINVVSRGPSWTCGDYSGASFTEYFSTADVGSYSRGNIEGWVGQTGLFAGASYMNWNNLDRGGNLGVQPFTYGSDYAGDIKFNRMISSDAMLTVAVQHFEQPEIPRSDRFSPFALGPPVNVPRPTFFDPQQRDLAYVRLQGVNLNDFVDAYMITGSYGRHKEGSREYTGFTSGDRNDITKYNTLDVGEFDVNTAGLTALFTTEIGALGKLTYGTDWYHDHVDAYKDRYNNLTHAWTSSRTPQFPDNSFYDRNGMFLNWDLDLTQRWHVTSGVRYERIDLASTPVVRVNAQDVPTFISPSYSGWVSDVGLMYDLTENVRWYGSIGQGFRAPNLDDLVATNTLVQQSGQDIPSPYLRPERSINYETGLKFDAERFHSQVSAWYMDIDDNILRTRQAEGLYQRANHNSCLLGSEWYGEYLFTPRWSVYGNFAYVWGQDLEADDPLSRVPPAQGLIGTRLRSEDHRRWLDFYAWLVAKQDRLNFQDTTDARIPIGGTPGYQTLNVRAGVTLGQKYNHTLSVTLENIADQAYRVHGSGVDGPGFQAIFGYSVAQ